MSDIMAENRRVLKQFQLGCCRSGRRPQASLFLGVRLGIKMPPKYLHVLWRT